MNNKEKINWFGSSIKRKVKSKHKSNSKQNSNSNSKGVDYLGMNSKSNVSFLGIGSKQVSHKVNFLGKTKKYKMTPSPLFKKESIKRNKKNKLSKWGDADLDGSPNIWDCDPRNAFKDATRLSGKEEQAMLGNVRREMMKEKGGGGLRSRLKQYILEGGPQEEKEKGREKYGKIKKALGVKEPYSALGEEKEKRKATEEEFKEQKKILASKLEKGKISEEKYKSEIEGVGEKEVREKAKTIKTAAAQERMEKVKELMKETGTRGAIDVAKFAVEEKIAKGKKPTRKELAALVKAEKRARFIGDIQAEGKISREILTKIPGGEIGRVLTGAGVTKEGEYSRALKRKAAKMRRMTSFAAGQLFGPSLARTHFDSEPRGRGRPAGPSGEYKIGGRPVYESDFQNYAAKQNALNRMLPSQQQSATINPEYIAYMKAKKAEERGETQTVMTEDGMPMEGIPQAEQSEGLPAMGTSMLQTGQQQIEMKEKRAYIRATPDEIKIAQYQAQVRDNPLMAPNFMKGELKATGGNILTPIGPSILEAPQVFKGEMRNVTKMNPDEGEVKLGILPQTNPYGEEWLDIEIGSNKPVIRRRISEKWMDGRAL